MVVDRFGYPGGNMGPGMIGGAPDLELPKTMPDGLPGIPGEFIRRCEYYTNAPLLNHYFRDSQVIVYTWLKMMQEIGVQMMFNTFASDPIMEGNRVTGLVVENKSGTQAVRAKVVVDATGDADVAFRSRAPVDVSSTYGRPGMYLAIGNVDLEKYQSRVVQREPTAEDIRWTEDIFRQELGEARFTFTRQKPLIPYYRPAWETGEYRIIQRIGDLGSVTLDHGIFSTTSGWQYRPDPLPSGKYGLLGALVGVYGSMAHLSGDANVMNALEVGCRTYIFETAQFLKRYVPGFESSYLHIIAPYFQSRGGRSVISEHPITVEDAQQGRRHEDVIFVADDPEVRVHQKGEQSRALQQGFDFPYRQLLPREVKGLLVAGRAAIIQPPVTRVRWMVFLMGQAAGAAAALAAKAGVTPHDLNVQELQHLLYHKYQVPLGDEIRLRELGLV